MKYRITWGKRICKRKGLGRLGRMSSSVRESEKLGEIWIEEDNLTNAKKKATRHVNTLPQIQLMLKSLPKGRKRWRAWKPDIDGRDEYGSQITLTSRESQRIYGQDTPMGTHLVAYISISWKRLVRR